MRSSVDGYTLDSSRRVVTLDISDIDLPVVILKIWGIG
jgi:hypothetical protein